MVAPNIRERLSRSRAMLKGAAGKPSGFFSQYAYMDCVEPIEEYPAITRACRAADTSEVLSAIAASDFTDPFWLQTTSHMGAVDAVVDYGVISTAQPRRVIEIGSGRSTQVIARAGAGTITCIDPEPRLPIDDLPVKFLRRTLKPGDVALAAQLQANDVLFIDSSHIVQPGTDTDIEFNILFPELRPGVLVHVHDIFLPFAYPDAWAGRGWNEAQALAPWIASGAFEVVFPTHYMLVRHADEMRRVLPDFAPVEPYAGGSFWLRKK